MRITAAGSADHTKIEGALEINEETDFCLHSTHAGVVIAGIDMSKAKRTGDPGSALEAERKARIQEKRE